jgi:cytochrome c
MKNILKGILSFSLFTLVACNFQKNDQQKPDENRFTPVVLTAEGDFDEPMTFEVMKDGKVYVSERKGNLKVFDPITKMVNLVGTIAVNTKYTSAEGVVSEAEEGFMGFTVDPNFEKNHFAYLYYAHPTESKHILSRWELLNDKLVAGSEKIILEIPTQREVCCHTGGGMTWDAKGNLYLTVGNNTGNVADKSQTDERPGRSSWDDQRGAGNTNDLRGKILRIHPEADGTYSIPEGNLFPKGTAKTRPEIYTMGHRNAWRPSVDSKTGYLYWGEVGPDAGEDTKSTKMGMDELNQAKKPGFFGWPYFIGENRGYPYYDYVTNTLHQENSPSKPINKSINNTGLTELPPAQPAFISYPYGVSEKFPEVGTGSRCAVGGPVYRQADFKNAKRPFPAYYEGKWLAADLSRGWIMSIALDENGNYKSMERFLPSYIPIEPIDMKFGPDGDLYVLEYGSNWFRKSDNAKLVRIEYNSGNRTPVVKAKASANGGAVPFKLSLSSEGTVDYDGDELKYEWVISPEKGAKVQTFNEANPNLTLTQAGTYKATLTVTDPKGEKNSQTIQIIAGNEPPVVQLNITGNQTFFFPGKSIGYAVDVTDKEDGKAPADQVAVSIDYATEGLDFAEVTQQQRSVDASTKYAVAQYMISKSDCNNCHHLDTKSIGPMFIEIADKYKGKTWALDSLARKMRAGGGGVWGEVMMPAHPGITLTDAKTIINYILNSKDKTISTLPLSGSYVQKIPEGDNGKGSVVVRAAYTDRGATGANKLTTEKVVILHSPHLIPNKADILHKTEIKKELMMSVAIKAEPKHNGHMGYKHIDLTGIKQIGFNVSANPREGFTGGIIEIRTGSATGPLIGQATVEAVDPMAAMMSAAQAMQDKGGKKDAPKKPKKQMTFDDYIAMLNKPGIVVDIKLTSGLQDLYFVFKNPKAKPLEPIVSVKDIQFNQ